MKKRILSFIISVCILATAMTLGFSVSADTNKSMEAYLENDATEFAADDTVTISNKAEFNALAAYTNSGKRTEGVTFVLTSDIGFSGEESTTPIGTDSAPFKGTFDGCNHTVSGLNSVINTTKCGMFAVINGATIRNVAITNATFTAENIIGGIAASVTGNGANITNVYVDATIRWTSGGGGTYVDVGGIVGQITETATKTTISSAAFTGSIDVNTNTIRGLAVAGIVGDNVDANVEIIDCINLGTIGASTRNYAVGGIIGYARVDTTSIKNCINAGEVYAAATNYCGGILGRTVALSVVASYTVTEKKAEVVATGYYNNPIEGANTIAEDAILGDAAATFIEENDYTGWITTYASYPLPSSVATLIINAPSEVIAQATAADDGVYSVRFLVPVNTLDYEAVAIYITATTGNTTKEFFVNMTEAYTSVLACGNPVEASNYGGKYLLAHAIEGVNVAGEDIVWTVQVITISNGIYNETEAVTFNGNIVANGEEVK